MISFTGSSSVGVKIMENGAKTMKRLLMELGGKGALDHDRGLRRAGGRRRASRRCGRSTPGRSAPRPPGSSCHRSLYDQTVEALKALAATPQGRRRDAARHDRRPARHRDAARPRRAHDQAGLDEGATLAAGGARPDVPGYAVAPTLLVDVKPDNYAVREEFFGPVVVVLPFDDEDEAVAMANDSDYGLYSYVFAGDIARGLDIARRLQSGLVSVNGVQPHNFAPVRRLQDVRHRPRPRLLGPPRVQRDPVRQLGRRLRAFPRRLLVGVGAAAVFASGFLPWLRFQRSELSGFRLAELVASVADEYRRRSAVVAGHRLVRAAARGDRRLADDDARPPRPGSCPAAHLPLGLFMLAMSVTFVVAAASDRRRAGRRDRGARGLGAGRRGRDPRSVEGLIRSR